MTETSVCDCYHCGLPVTTGDRFQLSIQDQTRLFCCPGCLGVAQAITSGGLGNYYRYRSETGVRPESENDFSAYDNPRFQQQFISQRDNNSTIQLLIGGIHCAACTWLIEHRIGQLEGVQKVRVNLAEHRASIEWDSSAIRLSEIGNTIAEIGYQPEPYTPDQMAEMRQQEDRQALRRLGVAGIGMMQVGMFAIALYAGALQGIENQYRDLMRFVSLIIAIPVVFFAARPFFIGAWRGIKTRSPGMDLPVSVAIGLAFIASLWATLNREGEVYFDSIAMFTFLLLVGRYFEMRARHYYGQLSSALHGLLPQTAVRLEASGQLQTVALNELEAGDRVLVKPGQTVPADGTVVEGDSAISEAALTGEFLPQRKRIGDAVTAGGINGDNPITIEVTAVGSQLRINTIRTLADEAQGYKPRMAQLADRLASLFVMLVLLVAASTYIGWRWFSHSPEHTFWIALSVLVVSCPCALSLATPTSLTAVTSWLRKNGLLVTNGESWESLPNVTDIVFDKTGTLTEGRLEIEQIVTLTEIDAQSCLNIAAALERSSEHPIASAFIRTSTSTEYAQSIIIEVGQGIEGSVGDRRYRIGQAGYATEQPPTAPDQHSQWILLADQNRALAWFALNDTLREDCESALKELHQLGYRLHLLSGDSSGQAERLAENLSFDACQSAATPEHKLAYIKALHGQQRKVLMVGDGINDIPVLAAADVSVAMNDASDLAKTHADCIMLGSQLHALPQLLTAAERTRKVIRQNLSWALIYNLSAIPLAAMGWIPPYLAAAGMSLSSLGVVLNSLRLNRSASTSYIQSKR